MKILKKRARKFMEGAMDFGAKMLSPPHSFFFFISEARGVGKYWVSTCG